MAKKAGIIMTQKHALQPKKSTKKPVMGGNKIEPRNEGNMIIPILLALDSGGKTSAMIAVLTEV